MLALEGQIDDPTAAKDLPEWHLVMLLNALH